jgi:signal transduction histidine kinase
MDQLFISPLAMEFLPGITLHLLIFGYLATRQDKSLQTRLFNAWLSCLMLLMVSQFACRVVYAPWSGYANWMGGIAFGWTGLALAFQFAYRFPRTLHTREARGVLIVCTVIAMGLLILMRVELLREPRPPVYNFAQFCYVIGLGDEWFISPYVFATLYLLGQFWLLGLWARKTVTFSALNARQGRTPPSTQGRRRQLQRAGKALWQPQGREARAARAFFLLAAIRLLSVLAFILEPVGVLPPGSFALVYLPTLLLIVLAYVNHSPEPLLLMVKLVGISLGALLVVLGLVNVIALDTSHDVYEGARRAELAQIKALVEADGIAAQVPVEVLYVAARPLAGGLFSSTYNVLFSRVRDLRGRDLAQQDARLKAELAGSFINRVAVWIENPWLGPRQVYLGPESEFDRLTVPEGAPAYRGADARPERQYVRYAFVSQNGNTLYEVGYSYLGYRRMLHHRAVPLVYLTLAVTLMLLLVFPRFFQLSLVRPLRDLLEGVRRVNAGDLYVDVPVRAEDEIGFLTGAFNEVVRSLQTLHADLQREVSERQRVEAQARASNVRLEQRVVDRTRELSALYQVLAVTSQDLDLDRLLDESLGRVVMALQSDGGLIYLLGEGDASGAPPLRLAAHWGISPGILAQVDPWPAGQDPVAWVVERRQPLLISDTTTNPRTRQSLGQASPLTLLLTPLHVGGRVLGVLGLARRPEQGFNQREITLLASIADQMGAAVERDRLRRLAQQATVLEERQRLSRDLHDSVTQYLYGLVTLTEAGQAQLEVEAWSAVGNTLSHIGKAARQALKEMRLFIHQLRPPVLEQQGLVAALHQRLAAVEGRSDVQARLLADETIQLPLPLASALYQIAQEALNNALKHAHAASITVHLGREGERVVLEIRDDGRGFEPQALSGGGMGLINMRERAEKAGCELRVTSLPGVGTRIKVSVESKE